MHQNIWIFIGGFACAILTGMIIALRRMNATYESLRTPPRQEPRAELPTHHGV